MSKVVVSVTVVMNVLFLQSQCCTVYVQHCVSVHSLTSFDTVAWPTGRASGLKMSCTSSPEKVLSNTFGDRAQPGVATGTVSQVKTN